VLQAHLTRQTLSSVLGLLLASFPRWGHLVQLWPSQLFVLSATSPETDQSFEAIFYPILAFAFLVLISFKRFFFSRLLLFSHSFSL
jgi:hypothetical protein